MKKKVFIPLDVESTSMPIEGLELLEKEDAFLIVGGYIPPPVSGGKGCGCDSGKGCGCGS